MKNFVMINIILDKIAQPCYFVEKIGILSLSNTKRQPFPLHVQNLAAHPRAAHQL